MKHDEMEIRILTEANYMLKTQGTIRECANYFKMSKSTVHKDLHRLKNVNYTKYNEVKQILDTNWEEKYIRGGLATQRKYAIMLQWEVYDENVYNVFRKISWKLFRLLRRM